ncbi:MAG: replicative DNA helicase [Planctomycetaceae bacterium]
MEQTQRNITRLPPHSEDAEKSLLGAILLDGDVLGMVLALVRPEDFYATAHQRIYEACETLYQRGSRVDAVLIKEELRRTGGIESVGGETYLAHLVEYVPSAAGAQDYARIVSEKAVSRNLIHLCTGIQSAAYEGSMPGDELLDSAEHQIFSLSRGAADSSTAGIREILNETFGDIEILLKSGGAITGLATGFLELDEMTAGLQPGDLAIVAGRPSMGKTTFTNCVVDHVGLLERKPVVVFSLEVSRKHLVRNMLCARSRVELQKVRRGNLDKTDLDRLTHAAGELMEAPIFIDDSPVTSPITLRAKARRLKQKHGLGLVVVDYLQLMETGKAENRQQEIAQISRQLKGMARELEVPVIAISQLNRSVDSREDRRPRMSDLRESGALEQDADLILFLFREEVYRQTEENRGLAELIVAKQRNGPIGSVPLLFFGNVLRFENAAFRDDGGH